MKSGTHSSSNSNCHHHSISANTKLVRRSIGQFDWLRALSNVNVDEKVCFFTKTLLNIIQNFIPHETIIPDDKDLPWINKEIKKLMVEKIWHSNHIVVPTKTCSFSKNLKPYSIN